METTVKSKEINKATSFWYADWSFPIMTTLMGAAMLAGAHMFYVYGLGLFSDLPVASIFKAGIEGNGYSAAAAFGASFLFARVLEGSLVGILDLGGAMQTGVGVGIPAMLLGAGITQPIENFWLSLLTGAVVGAIIGYIIIGIRKVVRKGGSEQKTTFGTNILMGAGNDTGKFLGPLIIISACSASIPVGIGSIIGALIFWKLDKPIIGGAILGAMLLGFIFPIVI